MYDVMFACVIKINDVAIIIFVVVLVFFFLLLFPLALLFLSHLLHHLLLFASRISFSHRASLVSFLF